MLQRKRNIHSVYGSLSNFYFQQLIEPKYFSSMGFPGDSVVKNPPANAGDLDSIPGLGRSPGKGNGNPLQYSSQENSMDRGTWWATGPWGHKESDMTQ